MSFRDNLQHLRATRNMTQEQLAMLLGVSRQSVSKWEAERAYPEMDKLLKLCSLFDCTLDELVLGDVTERPVDAAARMPSAAAPQDVTGYDEAMRSFAWKLALGLAVVLMGLAVAFFLTGVLLAADINVTGYTMALVFVGAAAGLALIVPALLEQRAFRTAHPFVEDFYTAEQKAQACNSFATGLVAGGALVMVGLAVTVLLQTNVWFASAACLTCLAAGVFVLVRGWLLGRRCDVGRYNHSALSRLGEADIDALDDETLQAHARRAKRERGTYIFTMTVATAVGLVLLFVPLTAAQRMFWLAWPIGALICVVIKAYRTMKGDEA
ncbi:MULTISPECIES: helix-turn-helix transcriptional regulator [Gordonibacter]|uniref:Helix-turn-helix transcriptional regulator n=1 Tax=Gordonibacter faecis TaxID=3047475 RepID=A0ABT7DJ62_9ACTN|nr:helix-turn-helix transcriptional regulator [Gordonibacter sp. KGMB12511]MDJ1649557.1 helix-turn-helix transcriptional regulator [Gordonibacter sp. KGMB12511]HIW76142.1 helix-turn-helix domain-containing protein [Candidatus Gordonibacter avicola]